MGDSTMYPLQFGEKTNTIQMWGDDMKSKYQDLWQEKNYLKSLIATFITRIGDGIDMIAFSWLVYEITGSTLLVASIAAVNMIPTILVGFVGGVLSNYIDEKKIMWICDFGRGTCVALIAFLYFMGLLQVWHLFVITFLNSSFEGFRSPAQSSIYPKILKEENIENGIALQEAVTGAGNLLGLVCAPACISIFGLGTSLLIDALTFFACGFIIILMSKIQVTKQVEEISFAQELVEGFQYLKNEPIIMYLMFFILFINAMFVPISTFMVAYVQDYMLLGSEVISIFGIGQTISMILTAPLIPKLTEKMRFKTMFLGGGVIVSLLAISYGFAPLFAGNAIMIYVLIALAALILGVALNFVNIPFRVLVMKRVDQEYLGRTWAIVGAASMGMQPLANMFFGVISNSTSLDVIYKVAGVIALILYISQFPIKILNNIDEY